MVHASFSAAVNEEGTLARRYTGSDGADLVAAVEDEAAEPFVLVLDVAAPPPPDLSCLLLALAASFSAFLASFLSSFMDHINTRRRMFK